MKVESTTVHNFPLLPLDPTIFLFFHKANGRVPATFQPKNFQPGFYTKAKQERTEARASTRQAKRAAQRKKYEEKKRKLLEEKRQQEALTKGADEEKEDETAVSGYQPTGFKFGQMS